MNFRRTGLAFGVAYVLAFTVIGMPLLTAATPPEFQKLYDYYFPKRGEYLNTFYRRNFDMTLFGAAPKPREERHPVYFAFRGNAEAFHAFVNHRDREGAGEFGETWTYECLLLLLRLGDDRFAELLAKEDRKTREVVGMAIDSQVDWTKHQFPKTRALYSYRWIPLSKQEMKQRHGPATVEVEVKISPDDLGRLEAALATDTRFSDVLVYRNHGAKGVVLIKAPQALPKKDIADLQNMIQRQSHSKIPVILR